MRFKVPLIVSISILCGCAVQVKLPKSIETIEPATQAMFAGLALHDGDGRCVAVMTLASETTHSETDLVGEGIRVFSSSNLCCREGRDIAVAGLSRADAMRFVSVAALKYDSLVLTQGVVDLAPEICASLREYGWTTISQGWKDVQIFERSSQALK